MAVTQHTLTVLASRPPSASLNLCNQKSRHHNALILSAVGSYHLNWTLPGTSSAPEQHAKTLYEFSVLEAPVAPVKTYILTCSHLDTLKLKEEKQLNL